MQAGGEIFHETLIPLLDDANRGMMDTGDPLVNHVLADKILKDQPNLRAKILASNSTFRRRRGFVPYCGR